MDEHHRRVEITTGTIAKAILLVIATFALFALKDIVLVVLTAVVIASAVEPAIVWFIKRRIPRIFAAILTYGIIGSLLVGAFYTLVPKLLQDTAEFLATAPQYINSASLCNPLGSETTNEAKQVAVGTSQGIQNIAQKRLITLASLNSSAVAPTPQNGGQLSVQDALLSTMSLQVSYARQARSSVACSRSSLSSFSRSIWPSRKTG